MKNNYFKMLAKDVNPILIKNYKINLNFYNFDAYHDSLKRMDSFDIENLFNISHDSLFWYNYLSELYNLLLILEDEYKTKNLKYQGIEEIIKSSIKKHQNVDDIITDILNKFSIKDMNHLNLLKEDSLSKHKIIRKFNKVLKSKIKFCEAMHFKSRGLLNKAMYDLHFGYNY